MELKDSWGLFCRIHLSHKGRLNYTVRTVVLGALLRHDRTLVLAGLVLVIALSWLWLLTVCWAQDGRDGHGRRPHHADGAARGRSICGDDLPHVDHHDGGDDAAQRCARYSVGDCADEKQKWVSTPDAKRASAEFALGYVAVWAAFSLVATALQWRLDRAGLLSETMASGSVVLAALLLLAAGLYQLTPGSRPACNTADRQWISLRDIGDGALSVRCSPERGTAHTASDAAGC